ncbi:hypothetical protein ACROYT_G035280 [Oculina patagonica]
MTDSWQPSASGLLIPPSTKPSAFSAGTSLLWTSTKQSTLCFPPVTAVNLRRLSLKTSVHPQSSADTPPITGVSISFAADITKRYRQLTIRETKSSYILTSFLPQCHQCVMLSSPLPLRQWSDCQCGSCPWLLRLFSETKYFSLMGDYHSSGSYSAFSAGSSKPPPSPIPKDVVLTPSPTEDQDLPPISEDILSTPGPPEAPLDLSVANVTPPAPSAAKPTGKSYRTQKALFWQ